ncbi:amidinotransferase [Amycolatopsis acidiphila]|uniref:Amidinotransferase n=2 Tax=Amycolatopsis acidiphila TaxID=715473 RepID=A0A557ZQP9_9PSEU|nr:amidinotransferase [Amycolatopsis acidiphila]
MCEPAYFDVVYAINPWMDTAVRPDPRAALAEWKYLHDVFVDLGHQVELIEPRPGLLDMVFAANAAVVRDGAVLVANFRVGQRRAEAAAYHDWFAARGWTKLSQAKCVNEGQGDFLSVGGRVVAGSGFRSEPAGGDEVADYFGCPVVKVSLTDPRFYHLDTAFAVLDETTVMYYPGAFTPQSRELLREQFPDAIIATEPDAVDFGLNAVSDGRHVVLSARAGRLRAVLREAGYEPIGVDVTELLKGGGGVRCCTLDLGDPVAG